MDTICSGIADCLYDFQTLVSGMLAVGAALVGGWFVLRSSRLPLEAARAHALAVDQRKAILVAQVLATEFRRIHEMARQAASTIKTVISAQKDVSDGIRAKVMIALHPMVDDIDAMSLLPGDLIRKVMEVRSLLDLHNFDMRRAGGSFGSSDFQASVQDQAKALSKLAHNTANAFENYSTTLSKQPVGRS